METGWRNRRGDHRGEVDEHDDVPATRDGPHLRSIASDLHRYLSRGEWIDRPADLGDAQADIPERSTSRTRYDERDLVRPRLTLGGTFRPLLFFPHGRSEDEWPPCHGRRRVMLASGGRVQVAWWVLAVETERVRPPSSKRRRRGNRSGATVDRRKYVPLFQLGTMCTSAQLHHVFQ